VTFASAHRLAALLVVAALSLIVVTGCGGSDKPGYCGDVSAFESSVSDLKDVNVLKPSEISAAANKVKTTGQAAVNSAKSDFPDQTSAVSGSVNALETSVKQLSDSSTRSAAATQLPGQVKAVVSAADDFRSATNSKCG
jgi:hypothetical protein